MKYEVVLEIETLDDYTKDDVRCMIINGISLCTKIALNDSKIRTI